MDLLPFLRGEQALHQAGVNLDGFEKLFLRNVLPGSVRDVDASWADEKRPAPSSSKTRDVRRKRNDRRAEAIERLETQGGSVHDFVSFGAAGNRGRNGFTNRGGIADETEHQVGLSVIGNDVGSSAAAERTDIESAASEQRVFRQRNAANVLEHIEERLDGGMAEFRISGMREAAARDELITQRAFRTERQQIFRGLAVNQVARASRRFGGGDRAGTVAFFSDDEEQGKIFHPVFEKSLCSNNHGRDDPFGIAGAASPDEFFILGGREERRHGIHVSRERYERLSPRSENIESPRLDVLQLDLSRMIGGEGRKVCEEIVADLLFVSSYGLDVDERACKLENVHANGREKPIFDDCDLSGEKARSRVAAWPV